MKLDDVRINQSVANKGVSYMAFQPAIGSTFWRCPRDDDQVSEKGDTSYPGQCGHSG